MNAQREESAEGMEENAAGILRCGIICLPLLPNEKLNYYVSHNTLVRIRYLVFDRYNSGYKACYSYQQKQDEPF